MRLAVFTICSNQHVPQACVLFETVGRFLPGAERFLVLADTVHPAVPYPGDCTIIPAHALGIPDFAGFAFRYDLLEFSAALKPVGFQHLFGERDYTHCLYFDPDIELFSAIPAVTEALAANASFIFTPHILSPAEGTDGPDDVAVMRAGVFNLGFLGMSATPEARQLLAWWARWSRRYCVNDKPVGLYLDQKFMDLVPGFAAGTCILHDPGLNVAHWNLAQRQFVPDAPAGPQVDGAALGFFHYDGFDASCPGQLSRDTDLFRGDAMPPAWHRFLSGYADRLRDAGDRLVPAGSYAYGRFASGVPIPAIARRMFRDDHEAWAGDPFATFEAWAHLPAREAVLGLGSAIPSLVMQWLRARHPDLATVSFAQAAGSRHVTRWWLENGTAIGVDRRFLEPQALAVGKRPVSSRADCPAPDWQRADAAVIAPFAGDAPAGQLGRALQASLSLVAGHVEVIDSEGGGAARTDGRCLAVCAPPDALATLLDAVGPRLPDAAYRVFIPSAAPAGTRPPLGDALARVDEIWAPTRFLQASLALETELPVLHMPAAWRFPAPGAGMPGLPGRPYILAEAGPDAIGDLLGALQCYAAAFGSQPEASRPVLLIPGAGADAAVRAAAAVQPGAVVIDTPDPSGTTVVAGAACLLFLHRGEALGLPVARAMSFGVPVVATDYGGCTDLLTPQTGFPVECRTLDREADPGHAAWSLRDVFGRPAEARRRSANARQLLRTVNSPASVAAQQASRLETLGLVHGWTRSVAA